MSPGFCPRLSETKGQNSDFSFNRSNSRKFGIEHTGDKMKAKAAMVLIVAWMHTASMATHRRSAPSCSSVSAGLRLRGGRGTPRWDEKEGEGEVVQAWWPQDGTAHDGEGSECMGCGGVWDAGGGVDPEDGLFYCSACWQGLEEEFSVWNRRWLRAEDRTPLQQRDREPGELKVVSYNILGEYHALRPLHDYCPLELRVWGGEGGRAKRISDEVLFYESDVVCMQEVTPRMFDLELKYLLGGSYDGIHSAMSLLPESGAETVVPVSSAQDEAASRGRALDDIGLAIFVKRETYAVDAWQSSELRDYLPPDRPVGALREKLTSLSSSVLMLLLRCRDTGARVLAVNTQLFWHPESPHIKALQTDLVCRAVSAFLARESDASLEAVPAVLCGDLNSVPHMQLAFLPLRQQEFLRSLMNPQDDSGAEVETGGMDETGERHGAGESRCHGEQGGGVQKLPEEHRRSGVMQLLQSASLRQDHPEHPDCFGKGWEGPSGGKPFSLMSGEEKKLMRKLKKKQQRFNPTSQGRAVVYGDLSTHGLSFQHAYAAAWEQMAADCNDERGASSSRCGGGGEGAAAAEAADGAGVERDACAVAGQAPAACNISRALPMTTCTPSFCGSIDHIWHTRTRGLRLRGTLQLPYTLSHTATDPADTRVHDFPYMPNHIFASDHLAIGAVYTLTA